MPRRVWLAAAELHYRPGIRLHTASSGAIDALSEVYLLVEDGGDIVAGASVRTNIEYLTGMPEAELRKAIVELVAALDWKSDFGRLRRHLDHVGIRPPAAARDLVDCLLLDGLARSRGQPLATYLGGDFTARIATNQTLFWGDDAALEVNLRHYVAEGFTDLKLRVGIASFADDLRRVGVVRDIAGPKATIAVDANGTWPAEMALSYLEAFASAGVAYVEQPIPPGDWHAIGQLAAASPVPIMLDESIASPSDVEELARHRAAPLAHLKLVKLGGIAPLLKAARQLSEAGIGIMVGQMNEGALATAAAAHAALAARPKYAELYGAYGLLDDPGAGISYEDGKLLLPGGAGLGVQIDPSRLTMLWEKTL